MKKKIVVVAEHAVRDIQAGMAETDLMSKYGLTAKALESLYRKLVAAGLLPEDESRHRPSLVESTVELQQEGLDLDEYVPEAVDSSESPPQVTASEDRPNRDASVPTDPTQIMPPEDASGGEPAGRDSETVAPDDDKNLQEDDDVRPAPTAPNVSQFVRAFMIRGEKAPEVSAHAYRIFFLGLFGGAVMGALLAWGLVSLVYLSQPWSPFKSAENRQKDVNLERSDVVIHFDQQRVAGTGRDGRLMPCDALEQRVVGLLGAPDISSMDALVDMVTKDVAVPESVCRYKDRLEICFRCATELDQERYVTISASKDLSTGQRLYTIKAECPCDKPGGAQ